jgi:hypothetical protein
MFELKDYQTLLLITKSLIPKSKAQKISAESGGNINPFY